MLGLKHNYKAQPTTVRTGYQALAHVVVVRVDKRQLFLHGLFGNEVQHFCHTSILYDRHAFDGVCAFDPGAIHLLTASRAAQFPQAVQSGKGRHGCGAQ